jgi:hypothetical protein
MGELHFLKSKFQNYAGTEDVCKIKNLPPQSLLKIYFYYY